jgi:hypothetical protein
VFLTIVGLHVLAGLSAVISGAAAMLSEKGMPRHMACGRSYYWCLVAVFVSAGILASMRWVEDYHLFVLGALAFGAATFGRWAVKQKWSNWLRLHIAGLGSSYLLMLTAFYVDNGKSLPFWRDLPFIAYWIAPVSVGIPIMIWAMLRHPLVRTARPN